MNEIQAIVFDGEAREVTGAGFRTRAADGSTIQHLPGALATYSEAERAAYGIFALSVPDAPEGQVETGRALSVVDGEPVLDVTFGPAPAPTAPAEVAMHKVHKAALLTPWGENGETNLKAAIEAAFELLPPPSNVLARIEWDKAPNLVRDGATTAAVVAILGMTETQRDELLIFAATLP